MIFLQILGAVLLVILVLFGILFFVLRHKFGKYVRDAIREENPTPLKIHLIEDIEPAWLNDEKVKTTKEDLIKLGFSEGKAFTIEEMPLIFLQHFYSGDFNAVIYKHDMIGSWVEFVFDDEDDKEYTISNVAEVGSQVDCRPENIKYSDANASVSQLFEKVKEIVSNVKPVGFTPDEFREKFESAYKKDMVFRVRNGGASYEEFLRIASVTKGAEKMSDAKLRERFVEHKLSELNEWHYSALEEFFENQNEAGDEESFCDYFIVPEKAYVPALLEYLEEQRFITEKQLEKLKTLVKKHPDVTAYKVVEKINSLFSPERQAKLVGTQDFPLTMRVYLSDL